VTTLDSRDDSGDEPVMSESTVSLDQVNSLSHEDFVATFGDIAEHSPWVAEKAAAERPFADRRAMAEAFIDALLTAGEPEKLALIRAHPDLAGRAAIAGDLAEESKREQASAGLDQLTDDERARFSALNEAYQARFGFPFVMAVKGRSKDEIMAAFERRLQHDRARELRTALEQIERIALLRLNELLPS